MRHVYYSAEPHFGHHTNWGGVLMTALFVAAFVLLALWVVGLIQGDAALFDWLPGSP